MFRCIIRVVGGDHVYVPVVVVAGVAGTAVETPTAVAVVEFVEFGAVVVNVVVGIGVFVTALVALVVIAA